MYYHNYILLLIICFGTLTACTVLEPAPPAASFIHVDSLSFSTKTDGSQGSNASHITDVWVIYDNVFLGTFPLPADFPLLGEGTHHVQFKGGVIENGLASLRSAYPEYNVFDTTLTLVANQKQTIKPRVSYNAGVTFPQIEDFDDASLTLQSVNITDAALIITGSGDTDAFEGNSGKTTLDSNHPNFEVASSTPFTLPTVVPTYLELNYKCQNEFTIGMYISTSSGVVKAPMLTLIPTEKWKKVYVNLSDLGGVHAEGINYKVYLRAEKSAGLSIADLFFDNLKIVY
jgi:hypothetical protein